MNPIMHGGLVIYEPSLWFILVFITQPIQSQQEPQRNWMRTLLFHRVKSTTTALSHRYHLSCVTPLSHIKSVTTKSEMFDLGLLSFICFCPKAGNGEPSEEQEMQPPLWWKTYSESNQNKTQPEKEMPVGHASLRALIESLVRFCSRRQLRGNNAQPYFRLSSLFCLDVEFN